MFPLADRTLRVVQTLFVGIDHFPSGVHDSMLSYHHAPVQAYEYTLGWTNGEGGVLHTYGTEDDELRERL